MQQGQSTQQAKEHNNNNNNTNNPKHDPQILSSPISKLPLFSIHLLHNNPGCQRTLFDDHVSFMNEKRQV